MTAKLVDWDAIDATEIAMVVAETFSELHPNIRMNIGEWADLREMIEREIRAYFDTTYSFGARALLPGKASDQAHS